MALGLSDTSSFFKGDEEDGTKSILVIMFLVCSFFIVIVLLNMLIAIMGDTFQKQQNVSKLLLIKEHLKFVIKHWHMLEKAIKDKDKI